MFILKEGDLKMFICNCPLCLHWAYSEAIFKLEYKNAVLFNHELMCIQLAVCSKEHTKSSYFSNIKYNASNVKR